MSRCSVCILYCILFVAHKLTHCNGEDLGFCPAVTEPTSRKSDVADIRDCGEDNGGWHTDMSKVIATPGPCNIDVLDSLSQEEFLNRYAYKKPFVVKNFNDNSEFRSYSTRSNMLEKFGSKIIRLSSANTHSYEKRDVTLEHYITNIMKPQDLETPGNETFYWFGDNNYTEWGKVFSSYHPPDLHVPKLSPAFSYGVADAGTGVPFHFHGPGFSEVIFGSKRWFLYPPNVVPFFNPNLTTLHWFIQEYPKIAPDMMPLECTIKPGEALYFPDRWWHATLNINSSVFISTFLG